jgi:nucleoid-associated protein YgaU
MAGWSRPLPWLLTALLAGGAGWVGVELYQRQSEPAGSETPPAEPSLQQEATPPSSAAQDVAVESAAPSEPATAVAPEPEATAQADIGAETESRTPEEPTEQAAVESAVVAPAEPPREPAPASEPPSAATTKPEPAVEPESAEPSTDLAALEPMATSAGPADAPPTEPPAVVPPEIEPPTLQPPAARSSMGEAPIEAETSDQVEAESAPTAPAPETVTTAREAPSTTPPTAPAPAAEDTTAAVRSEPEPVVPAPAAGQDTTSSMETPDRDQSDVASLAPSEPATRPAEKPAATDGAQPPKSVARAPEATTPADEPRESLVTRTIRRAITAIFGGSASEPAPEEQPSQATESAPPTEEPPAAATPSVAGTAPTSDQAPAVEETETQVVVAPTDEAAAPAVDAPLKSPPSATLSEDAAVSTEVEPSAGSPPSSERPAGVTPPTFDIVRVERSGRAVIAGRAEPGAEVEVRSSGRVIERVRAGRRGEWVATPVVPLQEGDQELTLAALSADRTVIESEQVVVVAAPEPLPPQPTQVAPAEGPPPQPAEVVEAPAPAPPLAVLLPRSGRGTGRILQAPGRISSDGQLALMMVDYDETGLTHLSGEAQPGAPVRIYVDDEPAGSAVVKPSGQWSAVLDRSLGPGDYTLRLDQLDASGAPVARLETPFTRVGKPPIAGDVAVDYVIVQPGNSLWRISRRLFGDGFRYVFIYEANKGQIRDPDLIYPGQVFEVPVASQSG